MPTMNLNTNDAVELAELLRFLHDWLGADPGRLNESLNDFAGRCAYDLPAASRLEDPPLIGIAHARP
jgi:hypothetical protein